MTFHALTSGMEQGALETAYQNARSIGVLKIGENCLFFRSGFRTFYIPFADIRRVFRRVQLVQARMCCGRGNLSVENLVICGDKGELAQIQLPGEKAGIAALEELKTRIPGIPFTAPKNGEAAQTAEAAV